MELTEPYYIQYLYNKFIDSDSDILLNINM